MQQEPQTRTLETERLKLKELTPELWDYVMTNMNDQEMSAYLGWYSPKQIATEREKHRLGITNYRITFINYLMISKESNAVIGKIGYHTWMRQHDRAEIGYGIDIEAYKNKGYMSEAMKAVLTDGFETLGLNRIEAFLGFENTPSKKLVEKFGFVYEGMLRGHYCIDGVHHDSACYGLLRSDYEKMKQTWL